MISSNIHDLPAMYFNDNPNATMLRNQLIKNQIRISECEQSDLETTFFSDENIDLINKILIMTVYKSKYKVLIPKQSNDSLIIVMRYVFIEYARHLPYDIENQIKDLNYCVINEILPNVLTNIEQKINYLNEINQPRQLLDLPQNVNKVKNLRSISSIYFD